MCAHYQTSKQSHTSTHPHPITHTSTQFHNHKETNKTKQNKTKQDKTSKCANKQNKLIQTNACTRVLVQASVRLREFMYNVISMCQQLLTQHASDEVLMQAMCEMLMNCIRVSPALLHPLLGSLCPAVGTAFVHSQHPCLVDLLTSCVTVYGKDPQHMPMFLDVFRHLHAGVVGWFEAGRHLTNPDGTAGYFRLVCRMLRTMGADVFLTQQALSQQEPIILSITQWSIAALLLQEPHVIKQACNSIVELLRMMTGSLPAAAFILQTQAVGRVCVETCMRAMCIDAPTISVPEIARCLGTFRLVRCVCGGGGSFFLSFFLYIVLRLGCFVSLPFFCFPVSSCLFVLSHCS